MNKYIILSLLLFSLTKGEDCVPLAFERLSTTVLHQTVTCAEWKKVMVHPINPVQAYDVWNKRFPANKLSCVYTVYRDLPLPKLSSDIEFDRPYIWVGNEYPELIADEAEKDGKHAHMAICIFQEDKVIILSPMEDGKNTFRQEMDYESFAKRTLVVFHIDNTQRPTRPKQ